MTAATEPSESQYVVGAPSGTHTYAALDLGTNNCRLLIAEPHEDGFRVVESFSRIVRLGEGLSHTGQLSDAAMARSMAALKVCAEKIRRRRAVRAGAARPRAGVLPLTAL